MCKVVSMNIGDRDIKVADIKEKYIRNIAEVAQRSGIFDRVILFGSSIDERCKEDSDIDIAVFGDETEYKMLRSKKYDVFRSQLRSYDEGDQAYDILYFKTDSPRNKSAILNDIYAGEILYEKVSQ